MSRIAQGLPFSEKDRKRYYSYAMALAISVATVCLYFTYLAFANDGELSEWLKEPASKTGLQ